MVLLVFNFNTSMLNQYSLQSSCLYSCVYSPPQLRMMANIPGQIVCINKLTLYTNGCKMSYLLIVFIPQGYFSHVMAKPAFAICEQQRRRSTSLFAAWIVIISLFAIAEISRPSLVSSAEQAGLSLTWSETPKANANSVMGPSETSIT